MSEQEFSGEHENPPTGNTPAPKVARGKKLNGAGGEDHPELPPDHVPILQSSGVPRTLAELEVDASVPPPAAEPDVKKPSLKLVSSGAPEDIFDDIEGLRKVAELKIQRRVVAINMEVRKPPDNGYFQCHPDPAQRIDASLVYDKEERDVYFVYPSMMNHPLLLPRLRRMTIATAYAWPSGNVFLWPVPYPDEKGKVKVWKSARRAFEISCGLATDLEPLGPRWTQMCWNAEARDYAIGIAEGINSQPIWQPDLSLGASLKLGFAEKTIATEDHYYVRQLRGLTE